MIGAMIEAARLAAQLSSPEGGRSFEIVVGEHGLYVRGRALLAGDQRQELSYEVNWSGFAARPANLADGLRHLAASMGVPRKRLVGAAEAKPSVLGDCGLGSRLQSFGGERP